jgi:hypothetical protein
MPNVEVIIKSFADGMKNKQNIITAEKQYFMPDWANS